MKIIDKEEFLANKKHYFNEFLQGKIFIYPTDTIYGIGCDATLDFAVVKYKRIKKKRRETIFYYCSRKAMDFKKL